MNEIKALIHNFRKLGFRGFMKKWREGIMRITPEQLLSSEIKGYIGSIVGITIAMVFMILNGVWYICFAFIFGIVIQVSQLIGKYQQLIGFQDMKEEMVKMEDIMKGDSKEVEEVIEETIHKKHIEKTKEALEGEKE